MKQPLTPIEILFIIWTIVVFLVGMGIGCKLGQINTRNQAVSKELAYYHPQTKAFTWRENQTNNNAPSH